MHRYIYIYIYTYREREREKEKGRNLRNINCQQKDSSNDKNRVLGAAEVGGWEEWGRGTFPAISVDTLRGGRKGNLQHSVWGIKNNKCKLMPARNQNKQY